MPQVGTGKETLTVPRRRRPRQVRRVRQGMYVLAPRAMPAGGKRKYLGTPSDSPACMNADACRRHTGVKGCCFFGGTPSDSRSSWFPIGCKVLESDAKCYEV
jgi:hypothetical protein